MLISSTLFPALRARRVRRLSAPCFGLIVLLLPAITTHAQTALFSYAQSTIGSGLSPSVSAPSGVAVDASGNVYIADTGNNRVVKAPPTDPTCSTAADCTTLGNTFDPFSFPTGVAADASGNVYVADEENNRVLKVPSTDPTCSMSDDCITIGSNLSNPTGVAVDAGGNVYIADQGNNRVLKAPPSDPTCSTPSDCTTVGSGLANPRAVAVDESGNVYIADTGNDRVLRVPQTDLACSTAGDCTSVADGLSPSLFAPEGIAVDAQGNVYVSDSGNRRVLKVPPSDLACSTAADCPAVGSGLSFPAGVAVDAQENVYITDTSNSDVLKVQTAGVNLGFAAINTSTPATQTLTFTFTNSTAAAIGAPVALTMGVAGLDFSVASGGSCASGESFSAGDTCTVNVSLTPQYAGLRMGAVELTNSADAVIATANVYGTGTGPQVIFDPGTTTSLGGGLGVPNGVAVDAGGNVYVADWGNSAIYEIPAGCTSADYTASSCTVMMLGGEGTFNHPSGVAVDGSGNIYVADSNNQAVKEMAAGCASSACVVTLGGGFSFGTPQGVTVDGSGNLYVANKGAGSDNGAVYDIPAGCASSACVVTLGGAFSEPEDVAVDANGNVYVTNFGNNMVQEIPAGCTATAYNNQACTVTTLGGGFDGPYDLALDGSGNLYVANTGSHAVKVMPANCTSSSCVTTLDDSFSSPSGVALDGSGNVYVADNSKTAIAELGRSDAPSYSFAPTNFGATSTDSPWTVTLQNIGNQPLVFATPAEGGSNPSYPANFPQNSNGTNLCSSAEPLAADASCNLSVNFEPATVGSISGSVVLTDNALNVMAQGAGSAQQKIQLSGTGDAVVPGAPTDVTATAGDSEVTVAFNPSAFDGGAAITGYTATSSPGGITATCASSPCVITGLTNGVAYTFTATATNSAGTGPASIPSNSVTPYAPVLDHFTVTAATSPEIVGVADALTVSAIDQEGNPLTSFSGTATLRSTDATAVFSASPVTFANGTTTATVTFGATGSWSVAAASGAASGTSASITVTPVPQLVVTSTGDDAGSASNCTAQPSTTAGTDSSCSLRDALLYAANAGAANIYFDSTNVFLASNGAAQNTITLTHGTLTIPSNAAIYGATGGSGMSLTNLVTVSGNSAYGVFSVASGVTRTSIANLTIANGNSSDNGGGISNAGTLSLTDSTVSSSSAMTDGGGIYNTGTLTVSGSAISGNSATVGGGIYNTAMLTVTNSTFYNNSAVGPTGGGGVYSVGTLSITNGTLSGNTAAGARGTQHPNGGGIYVNGGTLQLSNSIVAGNTSYSNADLAGGYTSSGDQVGVSGIDLAPLGNYGGPTQTMIPLPGSPAICAGIQAKLVGSTDQRGEPNTNSHYISGAACVDSGAVETNYSLAFSTEPAAMIQPSTNFQAAVMLDESGSPFTGVAVTIPLTLTGNGALNGGSAATSAGTATYSALQVSAGGTDDLLTASLALNSAITPTAPAIHAVSNSFNVGELTVTVGTSPAGLAFSVDGTPYTTAQTFTWAVGDSHTLSTASQTGSGTQYSFTGWSDGSSNTTATINVSASTPSSYTASFNAAAYQLNVSPNNGSYGTVTAPAASGRYYTAGTSVTLTAVPAAGDYFVNWTGSADVVSATRTSTTITMNGPETLTVNFAPDPVYVVTVNTDATAGVPGDCVNQSTGESSTGSTDNSNCSLRDAVVAIDTLPADASGSITFAAALGSVSTPGAITLANGPLWLTANTNIVGLGASALAIDGNQDGNILDVAIGVTATTSSLTLRNAQGVGAQRGGAVYNAGTLTLNNVTVANSKSSGSSGGGGIDNAATGTLTLSGSTLANNTTSLASGSSGYGGGILNEGGAVTVVSSTLTGNEASLNGGNLYTTGGTVNISSSTITGASGTDAGGGLGVGGGAVSLNGSTIALNNALSSPGVWIGAGMITVTNSIVAANGAATSTGNCPGCTLTGGDVVDVDPELAALGNYGGPTQTMIPLPGSPAICAGQVTNIPPGVTADQRGDARMTGYGNTTCVDAGAVETNYSLTFAQQPGGGAVASTLTPAPAVQLNENGAPIALSGISISMSAAAGTLSGSTTQSTEANGQANFGDLSMDTPQSGDTLTASVTLSGIASETTRAASSPFSITAVAPTITFTVADHIYGDAAFPVSADSNSSGAITYSVLSGPASISGNTVTLTGAGTVTLEASQASTGEYAAATQDATFNTAVATPRVSAWPTANSIGYGQTLSSSTLTGGTASVDGTFAWTTSNTSPRAGTQSESVTFRPTDTTDYTTVAGTVTLMVNKATPTVSAWPTANPISYGQALSGSTLTGGAASVDGKFAWTTASASPNAGAQSESVTFTPTDTTNYASVTGSIALTVSAATLTVSANNATKIYGTANPVFAGSIGGAIHGDTFTESFATPATTSSSAGTYAIVPTAAGATLEDYHATIEDGTLTVTKAGSAVALASSMTNANLNTKVTFTATVASATTGTPAGAVEFMDGSTVLGTGELNAQGVATFTANTLTSGTHQITALYSGDTNFNASVSAEYAQTITAPDYLLSANPAWLTLKAGQIGKIAFTFAPVGGYTGKVAFACTGLPANASCSFAPSSLTADGSNKPQTSQLTITTEGPSTGTIASNENADNTTAASIYGLPGLLLGCFLLWQRKKLSTPMQRLLGMLILAMAVSGMVGCGFSQLPTPSGAHVVTVTATATATGSADGPGTDGAGASHTATFTLTITP